LTISVQTSERLSLEQIQTFLEGSGEVGFKGQNREEVYGWVNRALRQQRYEELKRSGRGLVRRYIEKMTGLSRAQTTRLIMMYLNGEEVKSAPLKAEPSPFNPTTEEERAMVRKLILDSYDWFVGIVDERRPLNHAEVMALADGSIFTGRQALANKLIDALGGEREAIGWLTTKGVNPDLKVIEWKSEKSGSGFLLSRSLSKAVADWLGIPGYDADLIRDLGGDRIFLDGLLSLWHPDAKIWGD
jgi:hypothetical protein